MLYYRLIESHLADSRIVIADEKKGYTYQELHEKACLYIKYFRRKGLKTGDRLLITDSEPLETVVLLLACIAEGLIFVPVNRHIMEVDREEIIKNCTPSLIIDSAEDFISDMEEYGQSGLLDRKKCSKDTLVYIIYTSGTEGKAKGVCGSQKQILFCCDEINKRLNNSKDDRIFCGLPLSFDYGLYQVFLALVSGAKLYLDGGEVLQRIPFLLKKWKITAYPTLPTVAALLVRTGFLEHVGDMRLRYISFTGEVLPVSLIQELHDAMPSTAIVPMYGMTECKRVSVMPGGRMDKVLEGSCGLPLEGVKVWLVDQDEETGVGELVVEGPNVMEGYWGIKDEDSGRFFLDGDKNQRIVYTGDLFRIDQEGFLYFCGRKNGIIKARGYRVNALWLENKLRNVQGVIDVAVAASDYTHACEHAVIYIYALDSSVIKKVIERIRQLPAYLHDSEVIMCSKPFPRNQNGKTDVKKLCDLAKEEKH